MASSAVDSSHRDSNLQEQSLLFLFDLEATGLNEEHNDRITEIAGKVFNPPVNVSNPVFSSLVNIPIDIPENVQELTGITPAMLENEEPISKVLPKFFSWIFTTTQEVIKSKGQPYHPVLVAHNGNKFDIPLLLDEMRRIPDDEFDTSTLVERKVYFADIWVLLKKEKYSGDPNHFLYAKSLSLKNLYKLCFDNNFEGHRALADVEAMERILHHPKLAHLPASLPQKPASEWLKEY